MSLSYPSGSVPLESPYYLERPLVEQQVFEEIGKPGSLVRIKGPKEMGKTSLMLRALAHANAQGYKTVSLNLEQVDEAILNDLNRFLRWLCATVSLQLHLDPRLDDYWDEDIGSKVSCTLYFRNHLLEQIDTPLVLALDEVNYIFEHPEVAKDVLPLLRSWYEEAKRQPAWQKLRLIVVHSTEIYVPLQLKQSPFNVGLPIELGNFTLDEVQQLAQRYGMVWQNDQDIHRLMELLEGHPALIHLAIYHLRRGDITLTQLLESATTPTGIYANHLQRYQAMLEEEVELEIALERVMRANGPITLKPIHAYKLSSMGLIKQSGDLVTRGCQLYQQYFAHYQQLNPLNLEIDEAKVREEVDRMTNSEFFKNFQAAVKLMRGGETSLD
jgi:hypothetical protein